MYWLGKAYVSLLVSSELSERLPECFAQGAGSKQNVGDELAPELSTCLGERFCVGTKY